MVPPEPRAITRLARLQAELRPDLEALAARVAETSELLDRWKEAGRLERADLVLVAVNLHGYYTALETLLERVARLLDETTPQGPTWHVELIGQMQVEVPRLRPAVIDPIHVGDLHELRKFRHFFRNAYVLDLDPDQVRNHAERLTRLHPHLSRSIERLQRHLQSMIAACSKAGSPQPPG